MNRFRFNIDKILYNIGRFFRNEKPYTYWMPVDELYDAFDCSVCDAMCMYPYAICPRCKSKMIYIRDFHGELLDRAKWCNQNIWSKKND
jgi:hypothetical protein